MMLKTPAFTFFRKINLTCLFCLILWTRNSINVNHSSSCLCVCVLVFLKMRRVRRTEKCRCKDIVKRRRIGIFKETIHKYFQKMGRILMCVFSFWGEDCLRTKKLQEWDHLAWRCIWIVVSHWWTLLHIHKTLVAAQEENTSHLKTGQEVPISQLIWTVILTVKVRR